MMESDSVYVKQVYLNHLTLLLAREAFAEFCGHKISRHFS